MKTIYKIFMLAAACVAFTQCSDYLNTSSPSNTDDEFVTSRTSEAFKVLSTAYGQYRQNGVFGVYRWNDPLCSDIEYYPEKESANNANAKMITSKMTVNAVQGSIDGEYTTISYASKAAQMFIAKEEVAKAVESKSPSEWTQFYGEAIALRAQAYFDLTLRLGDVPYGYENSYVTEYELSSRFDIYDKLIESLKEVEPLMYKLGENGITAERISKTYVDALIGHIALTAAGYQTIRTDVSGLYGNLAFEKIAEDTANKCQYARRSDYKTYLAVAKEYLEKAYKTNAGTAKLVTEDERSYSGNNPFQRHFQYSHNLTVSPEAIFELGFRQGPAGDGKAPNAEYGYAFGRGSSGGNSTAPNKLFAAIRMSPAHYYGGYDNDDPRRDVSATVTGFDGKGNEKLIPFKPTSKADGGGICLNKWDLCRMGENGDNYYTGKQRMCGMNFPILRMAEVVLMLAEAKAGLEESDAIDLVNVIRSRAFGDNDHKVSGDAKDAVLKEAGLELFGEGSYKYFLIRSGKFAEKAVATQDTYTKMSDAVNSAGYYQFANGNQFPAYVWVKQVEGAKMTHECTDPSDPVEFPGWRGVLDFKNLYGLSVNGTAHNTAIMGLFNYIDPESETAKALEAEGYEKTEYGLDFANNIVTYLDNMLPGITSVNDVPKYLWPIHAEILKQSKGAVTNGYGLPQAD